MLDEAEIDRQEREKDQKLAARQAEVNSNNTSKTADSELDDLLSGLDNL